MKNPLSSPLSPGCAGPALFSKFLVAMTLAIHCVFGTEAASAQYNERPDLVGSGSKAVDSSGRSIKNKRIRAIHHTDPTALGGTAALIQRDPFLAYQLGRNLNFREFRTRDGVFSAIGNLGGGMPDGTTAKITANNQLSCAGCHNLPQGNPGGGVSFHKESGFSRNSPHYYGAGVVEMLSLQIRSQILLDADTNGDGWINIAEASSAPPVTVETYSGGPVVNYGSLALSNGLTGSPSLNNIFRVWYVDSTGSPVSGAQGVDGIATAGFNFSMIVWGWGQGKGRSALNPTNRVFFWDPATAHSGLDAFDPSTTNDPDGNGVSLPTIPGAIQFPATHRPPDDGSVLDPLGFSRVDPDGDQYLNEISEGDLDLAEWFMLNLPRPTFAGSKKDFHMGLRLMEHMKCTTCHKARWDIKPQDATFDGDRRLFDLDVVWNTSTEQIEGSLDPLYTKAGLDYIPNRDGFTVTGIFSDFKHHNMGKGFKERDFGGIENTIWRTPFLWGVGSGFPWGHDGQSLTIEHAILRHGGEGTGSKMAYKNATPTEQARLLEFLSNLVLYDIESLPADIDGDGLISSSFMVAGMNTELERFNAEWLFNTPLQIQGPVTVAGKAINSFAGINIDQAYQQLAPYRIDPDNDGWPTVWDAAPGILGYKDGVN